MQWLRRIVFRRRDVQRFETDERIWDPRGIGRGAYGNDSRHSGAAPAAASFRFDRGSGAGSAREPIAGADCLRSDAT